MSEAPGQARAAIEIAGLEVRLGDKEVLRGLDLCIQPGEIVAYLGPNGSGKSTTMHVLTGKLRPQAGTVRVAGVDVLAQPEEARRAIAYVPEASPLYDVLTATEYLELVGRLRELPDQRVQQRARALLEALELESVAHRPLSTFSRGMRQRVVFASAFLHDAPVVLLDEPLYGLDAQTVLLVKEIVRGLAQAGKAILYCSHLLEVVQHLASRAVILHEGVIVADGPPSLLRGEGSNATLESIFRELTHDVLVEERARQFLGAETDP